MSDTRSNGPPDHVWYDLEDALSLLADLEDGRDALIQSNQLGAVMKLEQQIRDLSRRLHFDV